jgi:hypothetical protein
MWAAGIAGSGGYRLGSNGSNSSSGGTSGTSSPGAPLIQSVFHRYAGASRSPASHRGMIATP